MKKLATMVCTLLLAACGADHNEDYPSNPVPATGSVQLLYIGDQTSAGGTAVYKVTGEVTSCHLEVAGARYDNIPCAPGTNMYGAYNFPGFSELVFRVSYSAEGVAKVSNELAMQVQTPEMDLTIQSVTSDSVILFWNAWRNYDEVITSCSTSDQSYSKQKNSHGLTAETVTFTALNSQKAYTCRAFGIIWYAGVEIWETSPAMNLIPGFMAVHPVQIAAEYPSPFSNVTAAVVPGTVIGRFKIWNNSAISVTLGDLKFSDAGTHASPNVKYKLYYSSQNASDYTAALSGRSVNELEFAATNIRLDGGAYRYLTVVVQSIEGGSTPGDSWQLYVSKLGDLRYSVWEADLGYETGMNGNLTDQVDGLLVEGRPVLGTVTKL